MRFLCPKCKAKYQIADEKLEGRAVRMKCRKCAHVIEVPTPSSVAASLPAPATPSALAPKPPPPQPKSSLKSTAARFSGSPPPKPAAPRAAPPRPASPRPETSPRPTPSPGFVAPKTKSEPPPSGGLASAFNQRVREPQTSDVSAAIEVLSAGAGEEWYVGINGVPLGPVRLSTLRQKAAQALIDEDSLVWREGFEEWLPLRTFPELVLLVREARESGRSSLTPLPVHIQSLSHRPSAPPPRAAIADQFEQEPATVVASSVEGLAAIGQVTSDPFASSGRVESGPFGAALPPPPDAYASAALPAPAPLPAIDADTRERRSAVDDYAVAKRPARMHPAAYVLVAIALGFGGTAAVVLLTADRTPAPPPTIQVVTVTAPNPGPGAPAPAESLAMNTETPGEPAVRGGGMNGTKSNGTAKDPESNGTNGDEGDKAAAPKIGLGGGPDIDGPSVDGPGGGNKDLPQQLDQSDIERVVNANRVSVKRRCWEPALRTKDPNAPNSAKVNVSITVAPSGNVSSASASGGGGYPELAGCVASRVKTWKFPPSGGTSRANIPFAFFAQ